MTFILYSCIENERGFNLRKVEANLFRRLLYIIILELVM